MKKKKFTIPEPTEGLTPAKQIFYLNLMFSKFLGSGQWDCLNEEQKEDLYETMYNLNEQAIAFA